MMTIKPNHDQNLQDCPSSELRFTDLLRLKDCTVIKEASLTWSSANSIVRSSPITDLSQLFSLSCQINCAVSLVSIHGASGEPLHYHTSHLIGLVVRGSGWLLTTKNSELEHQKQVGLGDVIVIPKGVYHIFECDPAGAMDYIALEVSDGIIDYQKHWKG